MREDYKEMLHSLIGRRIIGVRFGSDPEDLSFDLAFEDGSTLELYFDGPESGWYIEGTGGPMEPGEDELGPLADEDDDKPIMPL